MDVKSLKSAYSEDNFLYINNSYVCNLQLNLIVIQTPTI